MGDNGAAWGVHEVHGGACYASQERMKRARGCMEVHATAWTRSMDVVSDNVRGNTKCYGHTVGLTRASGLASLSHRCRCKGKHEKVRMSSQEEQHGTKGKINNGRAYR